VRTACGSVKSKLRATALGGDALANAVAEQARYRTIKRLTNVPSRHIAAS
jgi:hypothetical protein